MCGGFQHLLTFFITNIRIQSYIYTLRMTGALQKHQNVMATL